MTGFGAGRGEAGGEALTVELRAVNGKFCEVKPRLPRELSSLEPDLVKAIKARISRGMVDVFVRREAFRVRGLAADEDVDHAARPRTRKASRQGPISRSPPPTRKRCGN